MPRQSGIWGLPERVGPGDLHPYTCPSVVGWTGKPTLVSPVSCSLGLLCHGELLVSVSPSVLQGVLVTPWEAVGC